MADDFNLLMRPGASGTPPDNPLTVGAPSLADAWSYNAQAAQDWITRQRAISEQQGLWGPQGITPAGVVNAAQQTAQGIMMGTTAPGEVAPGFTAYHGSPHSFDAFDTSKIGTGEGAQAYGHGLYFADAEGTARQYRDVLASRSETDTPEGVAKFWANMQGGHEGGISHLEFVQRQIDQYPNNYPAGEADKINQAIQYLKSGGDLKPAGGHMYEVQVNADPAHFLDWDKPLSEQSPQVREALDKIPLAVRDAAYEASGNHDPTGAQLHEALRAMNAQTRGTSEAASEALSAAGIKGIRYLDQGSRASGQGTYNHVVFDAATLEILRKYGIAGLIGGGAAAASSGTAPAS